jgi:hypothetical protein
VFCLSLNPTSSWLMSKSKVILLPLISWHAQGLPYFLPSLQMSSFDPCPLPSCLPYLSQLELKLSEKGPWIPIAECLVGIWFNQFPLEETQ